MPNTRRNRKAEPASSAGLEPDGEPPSTLLQRVIMPRHTDAASVRALYVDEQSSIARRVRPLSRTSVRVPAETEASFAAYFNAFPAAYWQRWSMLDAVSLRVALDGAGRVDVYRSKPNGVAVHVHGAVLDEPGRHDLDIALGLDAFEDGGWYWFALSTGDHQLTILDGGWHAPVDAPGRAAVTVGMPTFNRPADCVATLAAIGADPLVRSMITAVVVPDQGSNKVTEQDGYPDARAELGDRLRVLDQPNIGGSGGYARVMYEALENTGCEQILFMDDDIVLEPDTILRAVAFSRFARTPMLVGGQMLEAQARSKVHAWGEVVDRQIMRWRPAPNTDYGHDLLAEPLRQTPWLHRRIDVDYNAWWCCLIPRVVAEDLGLPLPMFIKWDDVEYALRAREAGYPTATVPGIGIWHMSFADKDDATDWQAYFHMRNRLVVAALHRTDPRPVAMFRDNLAHALRHAMQLRYSTLALQEMAIRDFLAGPEAFFDQLPTALGRVRQRCAEFDDGTVLPSGDLPMPRHGPLYAQQLLDPPSNPLSITTTFLKRLGHQLRPVDGSAHARPDLNVAASDARWFVLSKLDAATVASSDGRGVAFRKRDPRLFRTMLARSVLLHAELLRRFPTLRRRYRAQMPELTGRHAWKRMFEP